MRYTSFSLPNGCNSNSPFLQFQEKQHNRAIRFVRFLPFALLVVVGAGVYLLLTITLADAVGAEADVAELAGPLFRGPHTLFVLAAGILGWASVALVQRQLGIAGPVLWLYSAILWGAATVGGFVLAAIVFLDAAEMILATAAFCALASAVVAGCCSWLRSI
jgi:hypothetical protein